ncbi:MAG: SpoIID/LytB domain-containing protein [Firmicutes bacterium]|jgi:stage II sporulation protein D|nr:SpoIID/LytB domain-containing protein [Bacillota bacterium]
MPSSGNTFKIDGVERFNSGTIDGTGRPRGTKKANKKKKGGRAWIFPVLLILLLLTIFYYYKHETGEIAARADEFMVLVNAGEIDAARVMMAAGKKGLDGLHELMERESIAYRQINTSYLLGILKGAAEVLLAQGDAEFTVRLNMVRENGSWMVSVLPPIDILYGAFVIEENPLVLRVLYRGEKRRYRLGEKVGAEYGDVVYMLVLDDSILTVEKAERMPISRVMVRNSTEIEGEQEGLFPLYTAGGPEVYLLDRDKKSAECGRSSDLIVGSSGISFYLLGKKILAATVDGHFKPGEIRVVLNDSSGENLYHREVRISAATAFRMAEPGKESKGTGKQGEAGEGDDGKKDGDGDEESESEESNGTGNGESRPETFTIPANRQVTIRSSPDGIAVLLPGGEEAIFDRRILLSPVEEEQGCFFIAASHRETRGEYAPAYRGNLDIFAGSEGLVVVNELPLEDYLRAVVPGEMPSSFGLEALKAQAIVSRSYAYRQIMESRYHAVGAHVDDSIASQVYNLGPGDSLADQAIGETKGLVPFHDNEPIEAFFFSTSCGCTANPEEVWTTPEVGFPGNRMPYLFARSQIPGEVLELSSEEDLMAFIDETGYEGAYDRDAPFFRWKITMSSHDFEEIVRHNLGEQYRRRPDLVLTGEGQDFVSREIPEDAPGKLLGIRTLQRGAGGNMMVLEIEGTRGTYRLVSEYTIRFTIRPIQYRSGANPIILRRGDGTQIENFNVLPSAFAYLDTVPDGDGGIREIRISGGGYGHGVGLSQNGARGMAEKGFDFVQIIEHYYPGTQLHRVHE